MIILSHATGNSNARHAALALLRAGTLAEFWTCLNYDPEGFLSRILPAKIRSELERRSFPEEIRSRTHGVPWREAGRLLFSRLGWKTGSEHETGFFSIDQIFRHLDRRVARRLEKVDGLNAVYAYEDGALESFREAKRLGLQTYYDLPIGYHESAQKIFAEERELMPQFASTLGGLRDSPAKLARKKEELQLADRVIACSGFVKNTLLDAGVPEDRIRLVQFGAPAFTGPFPEKIKEGKEKPLRVLFAGAIGQRKGIGYLLEAVRRLNRKDVELILMGSLPDDQSGLKAYRDWFRHEPPRSHAGVLQLMRSSDVFVLPSIFEGQALVILEAMSMGLPVIITPNTGGANLVEQGREGFVIPIRSVDALMEKIAWMADHRDQIAGMGIAARARAQSATWENYGNQVVAALA